MLNPEHFEIIAGQDVVDRMRARREKLVDKGEALTGLQLQEAADGIRGAEIVRTGKGHAVRFDSGLQAFDKLLAATSLAHARDWALRWQIQDPDKRYVFMRRDQPILAPDSSRVGSLLAKDINEVTARMTAAASSVPGSICNIPMLDGKPEPEEREYAEPVVAEVWGGSAGRYVTQVTYMSGNRYFVGPHGSDYAIFGPGDFFREAETIEGAVKWLTDPDRWSW